jgi:outer membrane receptor protein involved in Fe transport
MQRLGTLRLGVALAAMVLVDAGVALAQDTAAAPDAAPSGEIVVTATRKSESLSRVPLSITALTQQEIQKQGIRNVDDIVRLTPGVSIRKSGTAVSNVSIRGISSAAGASTIGVYIDDTPIQVRSLGVASSIMYPAIFDLERIEVLRGPRERCLVPDRKAARSALSSPSPVWTNGAVARGWKPDHHQWRSQL